MVETEEEADRRREAAIAESAALRPNLKLGKGITEAHLLKLQELHRKRLKIKAKSEVHRREKGTREVQVNHTTTATEEEEQPKPVPKSSYISDDDRRSQSRTAEEETLFPKLGAMKRQKLHWGLDTKERWERKSNM